MFYPLLAEKELREGLMLAKIAADKKLLLVRHRSETYVVENKCGHFGLPLDTGHLEEGTVVCRQHGISFDLETGEVSNRPYENCEAIKTFEVVIKDGFVGVELD